MHFSKLHEIRHCMWICTIERHLCNREKKSNNLQKLLKIIVKGKNEEIKYEIRIISIFSGIISDFCT